MSKSKTHSSRQQLGMLLGLAVGVLVIVVGGLLLREYAPGNMGNGFLVGGSIALLAFAFVAWRVSTRPSAATVFERAFTQTGDERDDAVLTRAFAVLGAVAFPLTGLAAIAIAVGAQAPVVLAVLLFGQLGVGILAFVVIDRRS